MKRVETRSLKKATVAWLHLALISDTHRSTAGKKRLHLKYNLYTKVYYSFDVLVSVQHVGPGLQQITHMTDQGATFCTRSCFPEGHLKMYSSIHERNKFSDDTTVTGVISDDENQ